MVKVLVADDDLDSHELLSDILHINIADVEVERALNGSSFVSKVKDAQPEYDLILLNEKMVIEETGALDYLHLNFPDLMKRTVLLINENDKPDKSSLYNEQPKVSKPFSLDLFSDVIKKVCILD